MKFVARVGRIDCARGAKGLIALAVSCIGVANNRDDMTAVIYGDKSAKYPGD